MNNYTNTNIAGIKVQVSELKISGTREFHLMLTPDPGGSFESQLENLHNALTDSLDNLNMSTSAIVMKRYFLSDYANQYQALSSLEDNSGQYALSTVQQPPMNGSKIAVWVYCINSDDASIQRSKHQENGVSYASNGYTHIWHGGLVKSNGSVSSFEQTEEIFNTYCDQLKTSGLNLKDNCIRTWLFVRDVDVNYAGVVESRKGLFVDHGLTESTHYISSTGIEGQHWKTDVNTLMDAYAVGGIDQEQVKFLTAPNHLNPTHEYGVTFERGTSVTFGDRKHLYISGTASIDNKGDIVHVGDIEKQTERVFENIGALLADDSAHLNDLSQMIVYLRDTADYTSVKQYIDQHYPEVPAIIVLAPVCRPGWLIEIECIAAVAESNKTYNNF